MNLRVDLPHPAARLGANGSRGMTRGGVIMFNKLKQEARALAADVCRQALDAKGAGVYCPNAYFVVWRYKGIPRDVDNIVACLKAYIDGCCDELGMDDRGLDLAGVVRQHSLGADSKTVTIIFMDDWNPPFFLM